MKRKLLSILLMGVLIIGLTGCGSKTAKNGYDNSNNDNTVKSTRMYVLTCSHSQEADNEYEPTTNSVSDTLSISTFTPEYVFCLSALFSSEVLYLSASSFVD